MRGHGGLSLGRIDYDLPRITQSYSVSQTTRFGVSQTLGPVSTPRMGLQRTMHLKRVGGSPMVPRSSGKVFSAVRPSYFKCTLIKNPVPEMANLTKTLVMSLEDQVPALICRSLRGVSKVPPSPRQRWRVREIIRVNVNFGLVKGVVCRMRAKPGLNGII